MLIRQEFGTLAARVGPTPRSGFRPAELGPPRASVVTRPEVLATTIGVTIYSPRASRWTAADYRLAFAEELWRLVLKSRLEVDRQYLSVSVLGLRGLTILVRPETDKVQTSVSALLGQLKRLHQGGITADELRTAARTLVAQHEGALRERELRPGYMLAHELYLEWRGIRAAPGPETELALLRRFMPDLKVEEVNSAGRRLCVGKRAVAILGPSTMRNTPSVVEVLGIDRDARLP